LQKLLKTYDSFIEFIIVIFFAIMIITLFGEVVSRFLFSLPMMWAEEIGRYLFIWIVYLGAAQGFIQNRHLTVDFLSKKIPSPYSNYLDVVLHLMIMIFLFFVFVNGVKYAGMNFNKSAYSIDWIHIGWMYAAIPVGAILMFFNIIRILPIKLAKKNTTK